MNSLVSNTWYAIHRSSALGKRPTTVERLGRSFVLWRTEDGVRAAPSQCPHRGADLGTGKVVDGCLTCPYHGIRFDRDGAVTHRPAIGAHDDVPASAGLRNVPAVDAHGYIWIWHGDDQPECEPRWFDGEHPTAMVGADQIWTVHYSRFMESALDFHHVPFVHGTYTPGIGQVLTDVELVDQGTRLSMTARLLDPDSGRSLAVGGEVIMPCVMRVSIGSTRFVAVGTPVDDERTWVAANYHPAYTKRIPILRNIEAWIAMFVDFKLFQRQDRAIFEGLGSAPSPLERMNLMTADSGAELWIRRWREMVAPAASHRPDSSALTRQSGEPHDKSMDRQADAPSKQGPDRPPGRPLSSDSR